MLRELKSDPEVQKDILRLQKDVKRLNAFQVMLFVGLQKMTVKTKEAEDICRITGIKPPSEENEFKRVPRLLLDDYRPNGLEEYKHESRD